MEINEVKKELSDYVRDMRYLDVKQQHIEILTARINKITASYSDMPRGGNSSREDLIAKKIELENELYDFLIGLVERKAVIERTIRSLDQPYRNLLDFRYIENMSIYDVAEAVGYSKRQCERLLDEAYVKYSEKRISE